MVYEKLGKPHNTQNVNFNLFVMKKNNHPKWYTKTPVYCNGKLVKFVSSTQSAIYLDVWSGTHPFFAKTVKNLPIGNQMERFLKKYNT